MLCVRYWKSLVINHDFVIWPLMTVASGPVWKSRWGKRHRFTRLQAELASVPVVLSSPTRRCFFIVPPLRVQPSAASPQAQQSKSLEVSIFTLCPWDCSASRFTTWLNFPPTVHPHLVSNFSRATQSQRVCQLNIALLAVSFPPKARKNANIPLVSSSQQVGK